MDSPQIITVKRDGRRVLLTQNSKRNEDPPESIKFKLLNTLFRGKMNFLIKDNFTGSTPAKPALQMLDLCTPAEKNIVFSNTKNERMRIILFAGFLLLVGCISKNNAENCRQLKNVFINKGEGTQAADSVSERFKQCINKKYPAYPYSNDCRDTASTAFLYNIINEEGLLKTGNIISVEILSKQENVAACQPFVYNLSPDSLASFITQTEDPSKYCCRTYNYVQHNNEPFQISWKFCEPFVTGLPQLKMLHISHRTLKDEKGYTMIVRVWYRNI